MLDDIADSFDYKNKYAIVEYINYLIDLHANKLYMLILRIIMIFIAHFHLGLGSIIKIDG